MFAERSDDVVRLVSERAVPPPGARAPRSRALKNPTRASEGPPCGVCCRGAWVVGKRQILRACGAQDDTLPRFASGRLENSEGLRTLTAPRSFEPWPTSASVSSA